MFYCKQLKFIKKNNLLFKVKFGLMTGMFITLWVLENSRDKMAKKKSYYVLIKMVILSRELTKMYY